MQRHVITVSGMLAIGGCTSISPSPEPTPLASGESCTLSPEQLAARRQQLIPGLFTQAQRVEDIRDGLRFHFENRPGLLTDLAQVMEQEQDCCSFLRFRLVTEASAGPITFEVTGPAGTGQMLRNL